MSEALKKKRKKRNSTGLTNQLHGKPSSLNDGGREERYGNSPAERERLYYRRPFGFGTRPRSASKWDGSSAPELFAC